MYGLFLGLVGILCIAVSAAYVNPAKGRLGDDPVAPNAAGIEAQASSIAGSIAYAMADVAASCVEQPRAGLPPACEQATAATAAYRSGAMLALSTETIYAAGTTLGTVSTYVVRDALANYLVGAWLPATAAAGAKYCMDVERELLRITGNSGWVSPYDAPTQSAYAIQSNPTSPSAPLARMAIPLAGLPLAGGCPVMVEEIDQ